MNRIPRLLGFIIVSAPLLVAGSPFISAASAQQYPDKIAGSAAEPGLSITLPRFEDYPAVIFTGKPAQVKLASHPDAKQYRTRLTEKPSVDTRFAGHYRVVEIGCGSSCQENWAMELIDGTIFSLPTASYGAAYRADSRLIVINDPGVLDDMLKSTDYDDPIPAVENMMQVYGLPEYWIEQEGKFERIGPDKMHVDPVSKKIVAN